MNAPCNKCKNRTATCHGSCSAYLLWKLEEAVKKDESKKKAFSERQADGVLSTRHHVGKKIERKKG